MGVGINGCEYITLPSLSLIVVVWEGGERSCTKNREERESNNNILCVCVSLVDEKSLFPFSGGWLDNGLVVIVVVLTNMIFIFILAVFLPPPTPCRVE